MARQRTHNASPVLSAKQLGDYLGVDRHTIVDVWVPDGCPVERRADRDAGITWAFRLADVVDWMQQRALEAVNNGEEDLKSAQARKVSYEAELAKLKLEYERGRLLEIEEIASIVATEYAVVRARMLNIPSQVAPELAFMNDSQSIERLLREAVSEALEEMTADKGEIENDEDE